MPKGQWVVESEHAPVDVKRAGLAGFAKADSELESLRRDAELAYAESVVADAVRLALMADGRSLRRLHADSGLQPSALSRLANGHNCEVATLARLAFALDKRLRIEFV